MKEAWKDHHLPYPDTKARGATATEVRGSQACGSPRVRHQSRTITVPVPETYHNNKIDDNVVTNHLVIVFVVAETGSPFQTTACVRQSINALSLSCRMGTAFYCHHLLFVNRELEKK